MARGAEQSTMEEMRKERTVEGETKEYVTKDETTETVEVKRNHLCQRRIIRGQLRRQKELARIHYEAIQGTDRLESKQAGYDVEHRSRVVSPITDSKGSYLHQQVVQSNDVTAKRALDYRQYPDTPTDHRRHGKVDHEASTSIDTGCAKSTQRTERYFNGKRRRR